MTARPIRLAFLGGNGHHHLRGLLNGDRDAVAEVAVATDGYDPDRAAALARGLNITRCYDDPRKVFTDFKPDIASIGCRYGHNAELIVLALEHGVAAVSDKPIAATWEQLDALRKLHQQTGKPIITEFDFRAHRAFVAAREAVRQGRLGPMVLATAQKSYRFGESRPPWYANRADYGGTVLWVASHAIDAILFTTGRRFTSVFGCGGNVSKPAFGSMEDHTVSVFEFAGGGSAVVHADYLRPAKAPSHGDDRLRLAGGDGLLEIRDGRCVLMTSALEPVDITDTANPEPIHRQLLRAALGPSHDAFNTAASLETAAVLLHARDAADTRTLVRMAPP